MTPISSSTVSGEPNHGPCRLGARLYNNRLNCTHTEFSQSFGRWIWGVVAEVAVGGKWAARSAACAPKSVTASNLPSGSTLIVRPPFTTFTWPVLRVVPSAHRGSASAQSAGRAVRPPARLEVAVVINPFLIGAHVYLRPLEVRSRAALFRDRGEPEAPARASRMLVGG